MAQIKSKLNKSMSLSCVRTPQLKDKIFADVDQDQDESRPHYFKTMTKYTILLQDLKEFPDPFRCFVEENLLDIEMKQELELNEIINWCRTVKPLYPLKTKGDGNCLLHAVTLAMWGIHDSCAFLRRLLFVALVCDGQKNGGRFYQRWKYAKTKFNKRIIHGGLQYENREWQMEWQQVVSDANDTKMYNSTKLTAYDFLEDIHIFVLCNIIRRPVIILADRIIRSPSGTNMGENNFGGIYLPLLWKPQYCIKCPVVLGYANSHFTPLIGMENSTALSSDQLQPESAIPLLTKKLENLVLHFLTESEEAHGYDIVKEYLDVMEINWTRADSVQFLPCAKLRYIKMDEFDVMKDHMIALKKFYQSEHEKIQFHTKEELFNYNLNDDAEKNIITKKKHILDISLPGCEEKLLNIEPEPCNNKIECVECICKYNGCNNQTTTKYHPYCSAHKRKRSNSADFEDLQMENLLLQESRPSRNSINGKHENFSDTSKPCQVKGCPMYSLAEWDYMCLLHRNNENLKLEKTYITGNEYSHWQKCRSKECSQTGDANFRGQCKNCYIDDERKDNSTLCRNKGCPFYGDKALDYHCSHCALEIALKDNQVYSMKLPVTTSDRKSMSSIEILALLPGKTLKKSNEFYPCQFNFCQNLSIESTLGYCPNHFIQLFRRGEISIPSEAEVETFKQEMQLLNKTKSVKCDKEQDIKSGYPPLRSNKKYLTRIGSNSEEEILESASPSSSGSPDNKRCKGPLCPNKGNPMLKGLCEECHETLAKCHAYKQSAFEGIETPTPPKQCRKCYCGMVGYESQMGYCYTCFKALTSGVANTTPNMTEQEHLRQIRLNMMTEAELMHQLPLDKTLFPKKCITTNCTYFGDPVFRGFCVNCADERGMFVSSNLRQKEDTRTAPISSNSWSVKKIPKENENNDGSSYMEVLHEVENRSRQPRCLTENCPNYGSAKNQGYCSICAKYL